MNHPFLVRMLLTPEQERINRGTQRAHSIDLREQIYWGQLIRDELNHGGYGPIPPSTVWEPEPRPLVRRVCDRRFVLRWLQVDRRSGGETGDWVERFTARCVGLREDPVSMLHDLRIIVADVSGDPYSDRPHLHPVVPDSHPVSYVPLPPL